MRANQAALAQLGAVVWLTPEMDRLFFDSPAARRRFFDRLTFGHHPTHAAALNRYTHHLQARAKLLKENPDPDWLAIEEQQAAYWGVQVAMTRLEFLESLNTALDGVALALTGSAEKLLQGEDDPETAFVEHLTHNRDRDQRFATTHFGPHRTDLAGILSLPEVEVPLTQASMGQHKKALLRILIANAELLKQTTDQAPCLLLDEAAAHLDETARKDLFARLMPLGGQLWLTGTEKSQFKGLADAHVFHVSAGTITS